MILIQGLKALMIQTALKDFTISNRNQIVNAHTVMMVADEVCFNFGCETLDMTDEQWSNIGTVAFELNRTAHSFAISFEDIGIRFSALEHDLSLNLIERDPSIIQGHFGGKPHPFIEDVVPALTVDGDATIDMYYEDNEEVGTLVFSGSWDEFKKRNLWLDCLRSEVGPSAKSDAPILWLHNHRWPLRRSK